MNSKLMTLICLGALAFTGVAPSAMAKGKNSGASARSGSAVSASKNATTKKTAVSRMESSHAVPGPVATLGPKGNAN